MILDVLAIEATLILEITFELFIDVSHDRLPASKKSKGVVNIVQSITQTSPSPPLTAGTIYSLEFLLDLQITY